MRYWLEKWMDEDKDVYGRKGRGGCVGMFS